MRNLCLFFLCMCVMLLRLLFLLFLLALIKAGDAVACQQVDRTLGLLLLTVCLQVFRLLTSAVHLNDLLGSFGRDSDQIGGDALVGRVGDKTGKDVALKVVIVRVKRLKYNLARG